jgi:class 3 adenylate cyclase
LHRQFRGLLDAAKGSSEFAVVVNVDIRGFSKFSKSVESIQVAAFIKRVYRRLIDEYFSSAAFFKPTGDGLLIIITYDEGNLIEVITGAVETSFRLVSEFGQVCAGDPMINFPVPSKVGIGMARGSVSKIASGDKILDYSGAVLNLASRLMDLARPSGVVLEGAIGFDHLTDELKRAFVKDSVYVRSIAEQHPIEIYYTKDTQILALNKYPINETRWATKDDARTLGQMKKLAPSFMYRLSKRLRDPGQIKVTVRYPTIVGGKVLKGFHRGHDFSHFQYHVEAGTPYVRLEMDKLVKYLRDQGVRDRMRVRIEIAYPDV